MDQNIFLSLYYYNIDTENTKILSLNVILQNYIVPL